MFQTCPLSPIQLINHVWTAPLKKKGSRTLVVKSYSLAKLPCVHKYFGYFVVPKWKPPVTGRRQWQTIPTLRDFNLKQDKAIRNEMLLRQNNLQQRIMLRRAFRPLKNSAIKQGLVLRVCPGKHTRSRIRQLAEERLGMRGKSSCSFI